MSITTPSKYQRRSPHASGGEPMTEQSHKETCDIHTIMRRYEKTGVIEHVNTRGAEYANYVGAPDFKQAMDYIANAHSLFESVPSHIRDQFENDAGKYLDFMTDENNIQAIKDLGLPVDHLQASITPATGDECPPWARPLFDAKSSPASSEEPSA